MGDVYLNLEKRARQYVEREYAEEMKRLLSELQSYKHANAFLSNKIEIYLKELPNLYPIEIKEVKDEDEMDMKFQIEDKHAIYLSDIVLNMSLRLSTLYNSMKDFIDSIFDKVEELESSSKGAGGERV